MRRISRLAKSLRGRTGRQLLKLGLYSVLCLAVLAGLVARIGNVDFFSDDAAYAAAMPDVTGLQVNDAVKVAGVDVGKVTGISLKGTDAKLTFDLQTKHRVAKDARFAIRYQNLTGQRYIDIQQSTLTPAQKADLRAPGSTIDTGHTVHAGSWPTLLVWAIVGPIVGRLLKQLSLSIAARDIFEMGSGFHINPTPPEEADDEKRRLTADNGRTMGTTMAGGCLTSA